MRIKFLSVILSFLLMSIAISSCLDSDDNYEYSSDATIRAFGIDTIGKGIYYKFTIDQLKREIYNVDSLPVGSDTIIDKILIDTLSVTGWVTSGLNDTLFNTSDSVDLREPIKLKVHAADGVTVREYTIKVNVHKQDPDSLIWREMAALPASPVSGKPKSVILKGELFVYTSSTTAYRSSLSTPASLQWSPINVDLPEGAKLNSIVSFNDQLFITTTNGEAFYSDNGINWTQMDMQGMQMVTFLGGIPEDKVTGSKNRLTGIFTKDDKNYFCAKNLEETSWQKSEETIPENFPLEDIYSTVFTNASGIKQTVIVGNTETVTADNTEITTEETVPWFTMDGLTWADMSTPTAFSCPAMKNPSIMYYGGLFYMMGGDFNIIRTSRVGIEWNEAATKFRYPTEIKVTPGEKEDDKDTIEYISLFKDKGDYSLAIDTKHYIWIVWNSDGSVWRGRQNKLGFK